VEQDTETRPLLAHEADDADPWLDALRLLADRQLLHNTPDINSVFPFGRMHQILQDVLIVRLKENTARERAVLELAKQAAIRIHNSGYFTLRTSVEFSAVEQTIQRHQLSTHQHVSLARMYMVGPLMNLGRLDSAVQNAQCANQRIQATVASDPDNNWWQRELSVSFNKLGDLSVAQGDLPAAARHFTAFLKISERLAASDPANAAWQRDLFYSYYVMGDLFTRQDQLRDALSMLEKSLQIAERLAASDPTNATWEKDVRVSRRLVGDLRSRLSNAS
jgi:tetratricopeptide (TPR) repeat protein